MSSERNILEDNDKAIVSDPLQSLLVLDKIKVYYNRNLDMTPGKMAAQAIHAVLDRYGIAHGSVNVLQGSLTKVKAQEAVVVDAGWTETTPGSVTAGCSIEMESDPRAYQWRNKEEV